jgi:cysteine synthase A
MLGADVHPVPAVAFEHPENYNHQAKRHAESLPNAVWVNQFDNAAGNRQCHIDTTGPEIYSQTETLPGGLTAFICATGTGGTLAGVTRFLKEKSEGKIQCWLADPPGSCLEGFINRGTLVREGGSITEGSSFVSLINQIHGQVADKLL